MHYFIIGDDMSINNKITSRNLAFNSKEMLPIDFTEINCQFAKIDESYQFSIPMEHQFYFKHKLLNILNQISKNFLKLSIDEMNFDRYTFSNKTKEISNYTGNVMFFSCSTSSDYLFTFFISYPENTKFIQPCLYTMCVLADAQLEPKNFSPIVDQLSESMKVNIYPETNDVVLEYKTHHFFLEKGSKSLDVYFYKKNYIPDYFSIELNNIKESSKASFKLNPEQPFDFDLFTSLLFTAHYQLDIFKDVFTCFDIEELMTLEDISKFYIQCIELFNDDKFNSTVEQNLELIKMLSF